jgi:hypothetical protein
MADAADVTCRPRRKPLQWALIGTGTAGVILAALRFAYSGTLLDVGVYTGVTAALMGIACLPTVAVRVRADAYGLHFRTLLRRLDVPWTDVADIRVDVRHGPRRDVRHVSVALRDGHIRDLPLNSRDHPDFEAELKALRGLQRRYGGPRTSRVPVLSYPHNVAGPLSVCLAALVFAGALAWSVPGSDAEYRAWKAAVPCTAGTPVEDPAGCTSTEQAVLARTKVVHAKGDSWLYFTDSRPFERLGVSWQAARDFHAGDHVTLTVWRDQVRVVTGAHHVWRYHFSSAAGGALGAAVSAVVGLAAGALAVLRVRGRGLREEDLPSTGPVAAALGVTALWLLPLCRLHPTTLFSSPVTIGWGAAGSLVTLALFARAWHATRIPGPEEAQGHEQPPRRPALP